MSKFFTSRLSALKAYVPGEQPKDSGLTVPVEPDEVKNPGEAPAEVEDPGEAPTWTMGEQTKPTPIDNRCPPHPRSDSSDYAPDRYKF